MFQLRQFIGQLRRCGGGTFRLQGTKRGGGPPQMMTDLFRGARVRRGGRRPGWMLLSTLLVLAIVASSALVFTSRVELLKLAIVVALWAAVVAAFVSVTYRRQS